MRTLLVTVDDDKSFPRYEAGDELAKVVLNHLIGKEGFFHAEREEVIMLAAIHGFKMKVREECECGCDSKPNAWDTKQCVNCSKKIKDGE